jgi:WD40 repeat protein
MNVSANVPYPLSAVAFSPDGKSIAYAGQEGLLRLYDPVGVRETRSLRGHADWVSGVAFAEGGKLVAGAGTDGGLRRFPLAQDTVAAIPGHVRAASCVAISPDGTRAVTIGPDEWKHWDLKTGRELGTFTAPSYKATTALFTSPDEFVVGGDSEKLNWYSTKTGQRLKGEAVGGQQIYSLASNGRDIGIWQLRIDNSEFLTIRAGKLSDGYKLPGDKQETKKVYCATIAADATFGLAAQADKMVQVVDLVERKLKGELWPLFDSGPVDVAMVPDGSKVVAIDDAGSIKVATVADRKVTATAKAHADGCNGILVAKSGDRFATLGADGTIKAWDMAAKELRSWKMPVDVKAAAIAPDGRTIVTANADGSATVLPVP